MTGLPLHRVNAFANSEPAVTVAVAPAVVAAGVKMVVVEEAVVREEVRALLEVVGEPPLILVVVVVDGVLAAITLLRLEKRAAMSVEAGVSNNFCAKLAIFKFSSGLVDLSRSACEARCSSSRRRASRRDRRAG